MDYPFNNRHPIEWAEEDVDTTNFIFHGSGIFADRMEIHPSIRTSMENL